MSEHQYTRRGKRITQHRVSTEELGDVCAECGNALAEWERGVGLCECCLLDEDDPERAGDQ